MRKIAFLATIFLSIFQTVVAQEKNDNSATVDSIARVSNDTPIDSKIRVAFLGFVSPSDVNTFLNDKLSQLVNNQLQRTKSFRVVENEQSASNATISGPQFVPQFFINGQLIKLQLVRGRIQVGFIMQFINPETREIKFSKYIEVEAKETFVANTNDVNYIFQNGEQSNDIICEKAANAAILFLASKRSSLTVSNSISSQSGGVTLNETVITLTNANYNTFSYLSVVLQSAPSLKNMERVFTNKMATYSITHTGATEDLLNEINKKINDKYEITSFKNGQISIKVK